MQAMISAHSIQDGVLGQDNLIQMINQAFVFIGVDECLTDIAFILPKVHEVRLSGGVEKPMTLKAVADICLALVNQAYKLLSATDRFYVLLQAFKKFISCSFIQLMDGNQSSIFDLYSLQWFVALWNDTPVDLIPP